MTSNYVITNSHPLKRCVKFGQCLRQVEALLTEFNTRQLIKANARKAIEAMRRQSVQNGNAELTLDDINKEIHIARRARKVAV